VNEAFVSLMLLKANERGGGQLDDLFSKEKFAWSADWFAAAPNMPHKGNPPTVTAYFSRIQTELMVDVFPLGEDLFACAYKQYSQPTDSEKALNREIMMLGNFLTGSNVGTWEWNIQTGETDFNERWAEIIGYTLAELQPINIDTWIKFSHPNDIKQSEVALQRHFAGETEFYDNESRMKHKDGSWVWIHDRGKVFEWQADGSPLMMYGSHTDITKQKMVELALVESELRFNLALEGANIGLWDWDMKQNYVYF
jgi:PAS domain S-box-containing protein